MDISTELAHSACSCFQARRLSRLLTQRYDRAFAPLGITVNQYALLRHADAGPTPTITALAARLGMERSTLSRELRALEQAGWIALRAGRDARAREVVVTPAGARLLRRAATQWQQAQAATEDALGIDTVRQLNTLLDTLARRLSEPSLS
ncbi:MarR family winged helix-turn-helix transcriptional regulator [Luteimonas abyssi]|uniref:MarR family winged helix-turn-helix transcriptional regulator n=1 Tax=Luteimonas abyssi TaxID=1247514 RepID=UPI000737BCC6|nr:MarR family winged helix-turn-helix transcriptional regulator [Luteimonas abyssi]